MFNTITGRTIKKARLFNRGNTDMAYIKFTDGRWLMCGLSDSEPDEDVRKAFINLWNKAGTTDYVKQEWKNFAQLLESRGIRIW